MPNPENFKPPIGSTRIENDFVAEQKEDLDKKAKSIFDYIESNYGGGEGGQEFKFVFDEKKLDKEKEFLLGLTPKELKETFGEEMDFICGIIQTINVFEKELIGDRLLKETKPLKKRRGRDALPMSLRDADFILSETKAHLDVFLATSAMEKLKPNKSLRFGYSYHKLKNEFLRMLQERDLPDLQEKLKTWKEYFRDRKEQPEKVPPTIMGFENLDKERGERALKMVLEILPQGIFLLNKVEAIEYSDVENTAKQNVFGLSIETKTRAKFAPSSGNKNGKIIFYKIFSESSTEYLENLPFALAHEFGHALDARHIYQQKIAPVDQLGMLKEWEKILIGEPEWSIYARGIDESEENLKSEESFAESIAMILTNPLYLEEKAPKRYGFCLKYLKQLIPDFDLRPEEIRRKQKEYYSLIGSAKQDF